MMYRYFLPERPPMPGTVPKHDLDHVCEFDSKMMVLFENGRMVECYGYAEYAKPLTEQEIKEYELIPGD